MMPEDFINHFQYPYVLLLLALPPVLLAWSFWRRRTAPSVLYSDLSVLKGLPVSFKQRALGLMPVLRCAALCLGVVALARPQFGTVEHNYKSLGVDIALVMDVSGSMQAQDYHPNRLEAAKKAAIQFLKGRTTDRVTVVVFGEGAAILCPPTMDMNAAQVFVGAITDGIIGGGATAVGDGLALALKKMEDTKAKSRVAVLLTDGESNYGKIQPAQAAEIAKALKVRVHTIALSAGSGGRQLGGLLGNFTIPMPATDDGDGTLRQIADATGGRFFRATDAQSLEKIYSEIDKMEKVEIETQETADYDERFMYFWFPALGLIGLEFLLRAFWLRRLP